MKKRLKQLIKKHVNEIKSIYPEVYIEVDMVMDDILVDIGFKGISDEEKYEDLIDKLNREYDDKGYDYVYWGDNDNLTRKNREHKRKESSKFAELRINFLPAKLSELGFVGFVLIFGIFFQKFYGIANNFLYE